MAVISLLLATHNKDKVREFRELLGKEFALDDLSAHPEISDVLETGATCEENARLKARAVSRQAPGLVLADDSGLEVDSLGGAPGIFSARYAGDGATDEANRHKLLEELACLGSAAPRTARFHCVLALAREGKVLATFDGAIEGEIIRQARGAGGFGYDPLFRPNGFRETFAELSAP